MFYCIGCLLNLLSLGIRSFDAIVGPLLGLVYPLYASVMAIESNGQGLLGDDKQWLTYWVIYSLITLIELAFYNVIQWIPVWPYVKLILTCWLVLPGINGAARLYEQFVRPYILYSNRDNIWFVPPKKEEDDHLPAVAGKYTPVIEKRVSWADTSAKYIGRSAFDDDYAYY